MSGDAVSAATNEEAQVEIENNAQPYFNFLTVLSKTAHHLQQQQLKRMSQSLFAWF